MFFANFWQLSPPCQNLKPDANPPFFDLKIFSLNFNIGVDAIGPETDFTFEKDWKVVTKFQ